MVRTDAIKYMNAVPFICGPEAIAAPGVIAFNKYNIQFPGDYACSDLQQNISFEHDSEKRAGLTEFWRVALEKLNPRARLS